jgi:hypothetical protein
MTHHEFYREAIARRNTLREELREIEQFIGLFEKLFGADADQAQAGDKAEAAAASYALAPRTRNNPKAIADLAEKVIESANRPLPRGELVDALEGMGVPLYSDDKPRYIGTILWRNMDRFENIEGRGYWLKGRPLPETESLFQ